MAASISAARLKSLCTLELHTLDEDFDHFDGDVK